MANGFFSELLPQWLVDWLREHSPQLLLSPHYTIQIMNATVHTVFSEINVFYKRKGQNGIVFLTQANVEPGESRYYDLGPCEDMESYVIGFFFGEDLVAQLPPAGAGNMTPALASQYKPADQDPCADGWAIAD